MNRDIERFPEDFCFQLTEEELKILRFQIGTLKIQNKNFLRLRIATAYKTIEED